MALVEKYASSAGAGDHDGTSEANAWSLVEAFGNAVAGDRINFKGNHTLAAHLTATNVGTVDSPIILRGYNSIIGDGYLGRSAAGPLITTNMPTITNTGYTFKVRNYWITESIQVACTYGVGLSLANANYSAVIACYMRNSGTGGSPTSLTADPAASAALINSDFEVTGSTSLMTVSFNATNGKVISCRFKNTSATTNGHIACSNAFIVDSVFGPLTPSTAYAINLYTASTSFVYGNTFYGIGGIAIQERNTAYSELMVYGNNHCTDSGKFLENAYYGTANHAAICFANRRRDNTNADRGFGNWPEYLAVTTDTGGAETDFVDAANYDFRLISGAPGAGTGILPYRSIGALQRDASGAGAGGGHSRGRHQ